MLDRRAPSQNPPRPMQLAVCSETGLKYRRCMVPRIEATPCQWSAPWGNPLRRRRRENCGTPGLPVRGSQRAPVMGSTPIGDRRDWTTAWSTWVGIHGASCDLWRPVAEYDRPMTDAVRAFYDGLVDDYHLLFAD